jgi:hypothetical protein
MIASIARLVLQKITFIVKVATVYNPTMKIITLNMGSPIARVVITRFSLSAQDVIVKQ